MLKIFLFYLVLQIRASTEDIKWCLISEAELAKCNSLRSAISSSNMSKSFDLTCVMTKSVFDCMEKIKNNKADLINLDVGLAYHAILNYGMRAIAVENYNFETEPALMKLHYTANAVVVKNSVSHPRELAGGSACFSAAGSAEGWLFPLAKLIQDGLISVNKCNNVVKIVSDFFSSGLCAPANRDSVLNPLGENGELPCSICSKNVDSNCYCSSSDPFAGSAGALRCLEKAFLDNKKSVAFIRGDVIEKVEKFDSSKLELLCINKQPDGKYNAPLNKIEQCNWGIPQSRMLMTRLSSSNISIYQKLLEEMIHLFGENGTNKERFQLFNSSADYDINDELKMLLGQSGLVSIQQPPNDLMFSDSTKGIYFPPNYEIVNYFNLVDSEFKKAIETLNQCPIPGVKWCVIDSDSMDKCSRMKLALGTLRIQPPLHCVNGISTTECMDLISDGYADLMTLDAAELYVGGKYLNLVPIAIEFYGDSTDYYGVAVVKEDNKDILISNWKNRLTCHGSAGKAVSWLLPVTAALNTKQIVVHDRDLVASFAQLVARACIPGILDEEYNPKMRNPINLCEICSAGGADLCAPNSVESQYTDSGAFVCLLEMGDIAFVRHYTVYDNTDGRNSIDWARNKRMDDYELLCPDGRRANVDEWKDCHLGKVPGNTVVTGSFKSQIERENMWTLLRYAQHHFSSDGNSFFSMFESTTNRYDIMFSDGATSLKPIPFINQTYQDVLGVPFIRQCENLENLSKPGHSGFYYKPNRK